MVGQNGIKLAANLISTHFGALVSKVCECLLRRGTLTLPEIARFTKLPPQQIKNSLLVLIQHNCVQAFSFSNQDGDGGLPKGTRYTVIFDNILHRMRFSKFKAIVSEKIGDECVEILDGLLQHGRLTLEQIILRSLKLSGNKGDCSGQDELRTNFERLVNLHYVERCPNSESFPTIEEVKVGRRAKQAKFVEPETIEQQAIAAAIPSERFVVVTNSGTDVTREADTPNSTVGEKRKLDALELDEGMKALICEKEVLWRANYEEFICHLRNKTCVTSVRSRYDDGAGIVLNAMLESTRKIERKVKIERSVPLSKDDIFKEVMESEEGRGMTLEPDVVSVLSQLNCHRSIVGIEEAFSVDVKEIIEIAQNDEVESLVSKRYGKDAYKMFRLLSMTAKLMETNKISDDAFVEKKEALKILYNLWKDNYVHQEKVTAGAGYGSVFFLWTINKRLVREHVFDEMCHAALNLRLRLDFERERDQEILKIPKNKRNEEQDKRFERIKKVIVTLDSSLLKLDDALMLFHDF